MIIVGDPVLFKGTSGVVRFKGETRFAPGLWYGIELEEPLGKNDGSVEGIAYFRCEPKHGLFVRDTALEERLSSQRVSSRVSHTVSGGSRRASSRVSDRVVDQPRGTSSRLSEKMDISRNSSRGPSRVGSRKRTSSSRVSDSSEKQNERLSLDNAATEDIIQSQPSVEEEKLISIELEQQPSLSPSMQNNEPTIPEHSENYPTTASSPTMANNETRLKTIIQKLQDKLHIMHTEIDGLKQHMVQLSKQNSIIQEHKDKIEEDIELLTIDKETLEEQNDLLKTEIQSLNRINQELNQQLDDLREEVSISREVNSEDTVESMASLRSRNALLEKALLKLKDTYNSDTRILKAQVAQLTNELDSKSDYIEMKAKLGESEALIKELQEHVESSIQSTEMIEKLTSHNFELTEENTKLKVSLQDLEDLRSIEQDLEKLHIETQSELQEQIKSLEISLSEKLSLIEELETQNKSLSALIPDDSEISTQDIKLLNDLKSKNENIQREKKNLKLQLDLINIELSMLKELNDSSIQPKNQFLVISKKLLKVNDYIKLDNDDLFLDLLALQKKHELEQKSIEYEEYSHIESQYDFSELNESLDQIVHHVEEEEFNNFPSLKQVEIALHHDHDYLFNCRDSLIVAVNSELSNISIVKSLVNYLNRFSINDGFNKVYQLAQSYQNILSEVKAGLIKEVEDGNEINKVELKSLTEDVELLLNDLTSLVRSSDFQPSQLLTFQPSNIIHALETKQTPVTFQSHHIEQVGMYSKSKQQISMDLAEYEMQATAQATKIEELNVKIGVLNSRLIHYKEIESLMKDYKSKFEKITKENETLLEELTQLITSNKELTIALQKAKNLSLLSNLDFDNLLEQKKHLEKTQLISEIHSLRNTIRYKSTSNKLSNNYNWLREPLPKYQPFQSSEVDELRKLGRDLRKAVERSIIH